MGQKARPLTCTNVFVVQLFGPDANLRFIKKLIQIENQVKSLKPQFCSRQFRYSVSKIYFLKPFRTKI